MPTPQQQEVRNKTAAYVASLPDAPQFGNGAFSATSMLTPGYNPQTGINATQLGGNTSLNLPPTPPITNPDTVIAGLQFPQNVPAIDVTKGGAYGQATGIVNQQGQGITAAQRRILELSGQLQNKGTEEAKFQQQFGLPEKQKQVQDQINAMQATQKAYLAEQVATGGRTIGLERQGGKLDQLRRREAIDMLGQNAALQSSQGNLQLAQQNIDNALKLEFEPIQAQLDTTKQFLEFNMDNFNRAEKQQAQALNIKLDKEKRAIDAYRQDKDDLLKVALSKGDNDAVQKILSARDSNDLSKIVLNIKAAETGVPSDIAEKIGTNKVGQKVNSSIDFVNSLTAYKNLYQKYADAGNLVSVEAQKNLNALRNDLNQKYSVANGQGAVQTGDRESYQKIIQGGVFFPNKVINSMDTLISSLNSSTQNDIKFLDQAYQGYATQFFQPQLTQTQKASENPEVKLQQLYLDPVKKSLIEKAIGQYPTYSAEDILQILEP